MNINVFLICPDVDCTTKLDSKAAVVLDAAQKAIADLQNNPTAGSINYYTASLNHAVAKAANVTTAPTVLISDADTDRLIYTIVGDPINATTVRNKLVELASTGYDDQEGGGGEGIIPGGTPGGDLLGLGLFNLNMNMPRWIWLALAGVALYKASTSKGTAMYGYGAAGLVAGLNYLNKEDSK